MYNLILHWKKYYGVKKKNMKKKSYQNLALQYKMYRVYLQRTTTWLISDIAHDAGQSIGFGEVLVSRYLNTQLIADISYFTEVYQFAL